MSTFGIVRKRQDEGEGADPRKLVRIISKYVEDNFEDVGTDFAKEALKMHYGVADQRNIRGQSSDQEEETLREEGVPFFKLPITASTPSDEE